MKKTWPSIRPATVFATFPMAVVKKSLPELSREEIFKGCNAVTVAAATSGEPPDGGRAAEGDESDSSESLWIPMIYEEACEQALNFAQRAAAEEQNQEEPCDASERLRIEPHLERMSQKSFQKQLDWSKIGLELRDGRLGPGTCAVAAVGWKPLRRRR